MIRRTWKTLMQTVLGCALAVMASAQVQAAEAVRLAYVEFFPYSYTEDGKPKGVLIDAFIASAQKLGFSYTMEGPPVKRIFQGIAHGDYDVFLGVKTAEAFKDTTLVSDTVIARIELRAWAMGREPAVKVKEDLAGKSIITMAGYTYGGWRAFIDDPANKITRIEATTPAQALSLLKRDRAPVLLQYQLPMEQALAGEVIPELKSNLISSADLHIVVSKKMPDAAIFLKRLETAFRELGQMMPPPEQSLKKDAAGS